MTKLTIDLTQSGKPISPDLVGIFFEEFGMRYRAADKGPLDATLQRLADQFARRAGAQYQIDLGILGGIAGEQGREA